MVMEYFVLFSYDQFIVSGFASDYLHHAQLPQYNSPFKNDCSTIVLIPQFAPQASTPT